MKKKNEPNRMSLWNMGERAERHGAPPFPSEVVVAYRKETERFFQPDLFRVETGLLSGDVLTAEWVPTRSCSLEGCNIRASRGRDLLLWRKSNCYGRDPNGRFLYAPYLQTREETERLLITVSTLCGYGNEKVENLDLHSSRATYRLVGGKDGFHALNRGDVLSLNTERHLVVGCPQASAMNGEVPPSYDLGFCQSRVHFMAFVAMVTEACGYRHRPLNGGFEVV